MFSVFVKPQEQLRSLPFSSPLAIRYLNKERQKNSCNLTQLNQLVYVSWQSENKDWTIHFFKFFFYVLC